MPTPDLSRCHVVIAVFHMPDCPACERYIPMLRQAARSNRSAKFVNVGVDAQRFPMQAGTIPIITYDVSQPDPDVVAIAERFAVSSTPTTVLLLRGPGSFKVEGALHANQIDHLLAMAASANHG